MSERKLRTHIGVCPQCRVDRSVVSPAINDLEVAIMQPYTLLCDRCFIPRERAYYRAHPEFSAEAEAETPIVDLFDDIEERLDRLFDADEYPSDDHVPMLW